MSKDHTPDKWRISARYSLVVTSLFLVVWFASACSTQTPATVTSTSIAQGLPVISPTVDASLPTSTQAAGTAAGMQDSGPTPEQPQPTLSQPVAAMPECNSPATLTPALTEGPYFKANSPERANLVDAGTSGTRLILTGYVLTSNCKPVAHALLDFWQADASGQYDNTGYNFRGHQYADANGYYQLTTVVPGLYPGRTEHIHVKVKAPGGPVLTSQLFFPGIPNNESDQIFDPALVINITKNDGTALEATYNFVITP